MAAGFAPFSLFAKSSPLPSRDQIDFDSFLSKKGTVFTAAPGSVAAVKMKLVEVEQTIVNHDAAHKVIDAGHEKFSLLFQSGVSPALEQDTYIFEHADLGRFEMFIVPIRARSNNHNYYQAIFNRSPYFV